MRSRLIGRSNSKPKNDKRLQYAVTVGDASYANQQGNGKKFHKY